MDFLGGIEAACESYRLPLLGGDTIALQPGAPRVLGLTVIGRTQDERGLLTTDYWLLATPLVHVPVRLDHRVGDAAAGLAQLRADRDAAGPLDLDVLAPAVEVSRKR